MNPTPDKKRIARLTAEDHRQCATACRATAARLTEEADKAEVLAVVADTLHSRAEAYEALAAKCETNAAAG